MSNRIKCYRNQTGKTRTVCVTLRIYRCAIKPKHSWQNIRKCIWMHQCGLNVHHPFIAAPKRSLPLNRLCWTHVLTVPCTHEDVVGAMNWPRYLCSLFWIGYDVGGCPHMDKTQVPPENLNSIRNKWIHVLVNKHHVRTGGHLKCSTTQDHLINDYMLHK